MEHIIETSTEVICITLEVQKQIATGHLLFQQIDFKEEYKLLKLYMKDRPDYTFFGRQWLQTIKVYGHEIKTLV